jgi:hypothetical protein
MSNNKEVNFILQLIDDGATTEEVRSLRKHFWDEDRLDMRSAAFQSALLMGKDPLKTLMDRAAELDNKEKEASKIYLAKDEKAGK